MEAFGRIVAVLAAASCVVVLVIVSKMAPVYWQKNDTVRSITLEYAARILQGGVVLPEETEKFQKELRRFGEYHVELSIYERRRFEGEAGRVYLYKECDANEKKVLLPGSYLRVFVTEAGKGKLETFLYGDGCTVAAGGRVP